MQRSMAAILAFFTILNGAMMLFAGSSWYASVPGVPETGPYNPHFVQDIGAAFLIAGIALAVRAWRPAYWPAAVAGAGFLVAHAMIHLADILAGHDHHAAFELAAVVVPSGLAFYSAFPTRRTSMRSWIAHRMLHATSKRYGYDTSYLEEMLNTSPSAFFKFARLFKAAGHREAAPVDACFAAKLVGALAEDCGPCTQLCVDMALEAGMPKDQIEAVLRRDPRAMNSDTVLGFRFADAVIRRSADDDEYRDAIRAEWGDKAVIDLTLALQMGRMFPMVKAGLGYAKECRRVIVDGHNVDVVKQAA
jgi:alkylhydroperoxidase family enzyme